MALGHCLIIRETCVSSAISGCLGRGGLPGTHLFEPPPAGSGVARLVAVLVSSNCILPVPCPVPCLPSGLCGLGCAFLICCFNRASGLVLCQLNLVAGASNCEAVNATETMLVAGIARHTSFQVLP